MKARGYIGVLLLGVVVFCFSYGIFFAALSESDIKEQKVVSSKSSEEVIQTENNSVEKSPEDSIYILRAYNSYIGIFKSDEKEPFDIIEKDMRALPELDQKMLTEGIVVKGETNLKYIIQDYES
ncbi:MAG: hypothetical protein Q4B14_00650 [Clostridia bacterium]|nr:hypothetical protein [Clostridia bacterium]